MDYEELKIGGKRVFICEEHHHVLLFWQRFKDRLPFVLTLDHHTDLNMAFQHELYSRDKREGHGSPEEIHAYREALLYKIYQGDPEAVGKLKHDEHVDAAVKSGIVKRVLVHARDSYYGRPADVYSINGNEPFAGQRIINNPFNYQDINLSIETKQLEKNFRLFGLCLPMEEWTGNFLLDIDLDYFHTCGSIQPSDSAFFKMLIKKSLGISIAKESGWIRVWREEYDRNITVEFLLGRLLQLIEEAGSEEL